MPSAIQTRDHEEIRRWAEERGGIPTVVDRTGVLRIDFVRGPKSGGRDPRLRQVSWDEWFKIFDESNLVFLHSPKSDSKFFKLVSPETLKEKQRRARTSAPRAKRRPTRSTARRRASRPKRVAGARSPR
jgi:hypothetical protein